MKIGDIIIKEGDSDSGQTGIILEINTSILGHEFIKVLSNEGKIKIWYSSLVKHVGTSFVQY
jgi:hypothetical protein